VPSLTDVSIPHAYALGYLIVILLFSSFFLAYDAEIPVSWH
jgi:hypothetical protein